MTTKTTWTKAELARAILDRDDISDSQKDALIYSTAITLKETLASPSRLANRIDKIAELHGLCADGVEDFKRSIGLVGNKPTHRRALITLQIDFDCTKGNYAKSTGNGGVDRPLGGETVTECGYARGIGRQIADHLQGWRSTGRRVADRVELVYFQDAGPLYKV